MKRIAHIENNMSQKFGIPRQSGLVEEVYSEIVFEPEFRNPDAVRGLEDFSHIWIIWEFDTDDGDGSKTAAGSDSDDTTAETVRSWSPMVRPPRLGGNTRVGVFATRSPNRPNPIGLSCVRLADISLTSRGPVLRVAGADLKDGTSILDIKPYLPYTDSRPDAKGGFADLHLNDTLKVEFVKDCEDALPEDIKKAVGSLLAQDPRPSYQDDEKRVYGMNHAGYNIRFTVNGDVLTVTEIKPL